MRMARHPKLDAHYPRDGYGGGTLILPSIRVTDMAPRIDGIDHADDIDWSEKGTVVLRHARCRIDPEP